MGSVGYSPTGSVGSPYSRAPYDGYMDCSQGICSIYCPQWCYIIFPPPPPFVPEDDDSATNFSPLIIAVIGILASAFLLVTYYTIISKYCKRSPDHHHHQNPTAQIETNHNHQEQWQVVASSTGLDESLIKSIAVFNYNRGDGLVEGTECAVCLSEFQENESLRLLPKCSHAFHLPCIDVWLKSHSNCPICRANVVVCSNPLPLPPPPITQSSSSSLQIHRQNDLILVVEDDGQRGHGAEVVVSDVDPKNNFRGMSETIDMVENQQEEGVQQLRRSISLGSFSCSCSRSRSCQGHLLVADILHISEDDDDEEDIQMGIHRLQTGIGSSRGIRGENSFFTSGGNEVFDLQRSVSTGRFSFTSHEKGKNSIIPS